MPQVKRLSHLLSSGIPLIAMSFGDKEIEEEVRQAHSRGLDVAELRIDTYGYTDIQYVVDRVRSFASLPTIATIRVERERGHWTGTDAERLSLFKAVIPEVHGIDVELSSAAILGEVVASAKAAGRVVIVSNHNFEETPSTTELVDLARQAENVGADYLKLSAMASSQEDIQRLAKFTIDHADQGVIVIGMGGHGSASRAFFPLLGSRLTYARSNLQTVSGQLPFDETFELLRQFSPEFNDKKINELGILDGA
jgi:3-dehydroquinate dehydratase-1